jgi:hypothetical protein
MSADNDKAPWTDDARDRLASLCFSVPKPPIEMIAETLGRTVPSVFTDEISRLGMTKPGAQLRTCMPCKRVLFQSQRKPHLPPMRQNPPT